MKIKDSIVLITGANRGIGKAYAEEFLKGGAKKIYLGVRNLDSVADFAATAPGTLIPLELDVTNPEHIRRAAQSASDVTLLVNNAGILFWDSVTDDQSLDNARQEMEVNFFGLLAMTQAFAPILKANGGGGVVMLSSIAGHLSFPGLPTYSASKAAVHSLIKATRMELSGQGTQVIGVYPGPIDTDMAKGLDMPKAPASQVALKTIDALASNREDVFPDATAQELYDAQCKDPKAVEGEMQKMYNETAEAA